MLISELPKKAIEEGATLRIFPVETIKRLQLKHIDKIDEDNMLVLRTSKGLDYAVTLKELIEYVKGDLNDK